MTRSEERNTFHTAGRDDNPAGPLRKPRASDDFFTDSLLDSSKIPTPSPTKRDAKSASASKPRRAIGNTRTLRAAWDATATPGHPSSMASDLPSRQGNFNSAPVQARRQSPVKSPPTTSSPPRGRQNSLPVTSPSSNASSPPRGLYDVYQRIAEEERLAAQEGEIEEPEDFTNSTMSQDDYIDEDRARLDRIRSSQSPLTFRGISRNTPQPQTNDANKENHGDDIGLTDASGMSFLENMTDQVLAAKLTPHTQDRARDRARLDKAIQKTTPLAFSKAQVGSRHALTSEKFQGSGKGNHPGSVQGSSSGSLRNEDANPPPNVPRTWGSKARVDKDWLRKIYERNGSPANGTPNGDKQQLSRIDWAAEAADVPLPSVEDSLTPRPDQSRDSTPSSLSKQTSLDRIRQWELNDFTGNNLQVSDSPPVKVRTNVPRDSPRDREIETLEKRAVTTNRLGEIRKRSSRELLDGKSRSLSLEAQKGVEEAPPGRREAITETEEEGEPIPDTPIVVYKASGYGIDKGGSTKSRPLHDRKDSRDSLQRLARAISESPRPSATPEDWSLIKEEEAEAAKSEMHMREKIQVERRRSSKEVADANHSSAVKRSKSADATRTPIVAGAWTDTILPDTIKTVKQRDAPFKYAQTPHVTGGWIDTPVATGRRQSSVLAPILFEELAEKPAANLTEQESKESKAFGKGNAETKPVANRASTLPRSALTSLLTKAKRKLATTNQQYSPITEEEREANNNDTLNLGDATIESLEDLLTLDNADMTTLLQMGAEIEARDLNPSQPNDKEASPKTGTETELLERLGTKLERLRTNIHDARKGISKLEHQVSQPSQDTKAENSLFKASGDGPQPGSIPCQSCGCPRGTSSSASPSIIPTNLLTSPSRLYLAIPIPRLWHPLRKHQQQQQQPWPWRSPLPRPTWLGYLILTLWLWYLSESVLCRRYCLPR